MDRTRLDLTVYAITDYRPTGNRTAGAVEAAVRAGATVVQLRQKDLETAGMVAMGREIAAVTRRLSVPLIVNDRIDVMWAIEADGVHVGPDDMPAAVARRLIGPERILGVSAGTAVEAHRAEEAGADYLGVGSVFNTNTKADAGAPIGLQGLTAVVRATSLPVVGIGGIDATNAGDVVAAGATGVAVISAIFGAQDITGAANSLLVAARAEADRDQVRKRPASRSAPETGSVVPQETRGKKTPEE